MLMKTVLEKAEQNSFSDESFMQLCALYQAQNERLGLRRPRILSSNFPMILPPENTTEKLTF